MAAALPVAASTRGRLVPSKHGSVPCLELASEAPSTPPSPYDFFIWRRASSYLVKSSKCVSIKSVTVGASLPSEQRE